MSGSLSPLTSLFGSSSGSGDPVLDALFGVSGSTRNPTQALRLAEKNETREVKATAAQPAVQRAIKAFTLAVNSAKSVPQLLANPAVMSVLLTANGMKDQLGFTALATKALTSKLDDPNSLVNKLTDTRWKTLAKTLNFPTLGLSGIKLSINSIADAYAKVTWQSNEDAVTPGLANALSFKAQASGITSVDQILGNLAVRTVITTALGIPKQIAFQSLKAQEQSITTRLDVRRLQDPKFVENIMQRYLIANSAATPAASVPDLITLAIRGNGLVV
jgi:hypothetical protein